MGHNKALLKTTFKTKLYKMNLTSEINHVALKMDLKLETARNLNATLKRNMRRGLGP